MTATSTQSAPANSETLRIGIPLIGRAAWIAGAIYTANLQRALELVASEAPMMAILLERGYRPSMAALSGMTVSRPVSYSHIESMPDMSLRKLAKRLVSLILHPSAVSLEQTIRQQHIDLLFPVYQAYPGITCAQVHWVPDFQHCCHPEFFPGDLATTRKKSVSRQLAEADVVILSSESARADALKYHPEYAAKYRTLPFALLPDEAWFTDGPASACLPHTGGKEFLIFPSQLWAHKGHDTLLHALAILRKEMPDILVLCPGYKTDFRFPNYFAELQALASRLGVTDNVRFLGLLPRHDQIQLMRAAKAVIQPSRFEGWSSLLEDAQCLGKPIFASDLPVHHEQDPPKTVYFPMGNAEALAEAIAQTWPALPVGFDANAEAEGRRRQLVRGRDFGLRFYQLACDIVQTRRPPSSKTNP